MANKGACSGWKAWHDIQPPGPATLRVIGRTETSQAAGHQPKHLPDGQGREGANAVKAHYRKKTNAKYSEIHILRDDVDIPVEEVW